tara:strand:- start:12388 stop:13713 length:1326 start_codon:yes stop_codon:yes gene_type:complete
MKFFFAVLILFFFQNCSFDNKSGIWDDSKKTFNKEKDVFKEFKKISPSIKPFEEIIPIAKNFEFKLSKTKNISKWNDPFYSNSNNLENFSYNNFDNSILTSKKLTKYKSSNILLHEENNLITNDDKGNIIVYSTKENQIISKFNFYKKRHKKIKKKLNLLVENKVIFASDNLGYFYAYNYKENKIIWAKNMKIPFRSNIKIFKDKIFLSNQENSLFVFNKENGNLIKQIPTEEIILKNQFINNLSVNQNTLLFLNTYGSLYSVNIEELKLNWFINLNQSLETNTRNIFNGSAIVSHENKIIVSSNFNTYIIDVFSGNILKKFQFSSINLPIIHNHYIFLITKNNFLIAINLNNNEIIFSQNIFSEVQEFFKIKKENFILRRMFLVNNKLLIMMNNSNLLDFNINGKLNSINKLPKKINSFPIFINGSLIYLNNKNKIIVLN